MLANILNGSGKPYVSVIFSGVGVLITAVACYLLIPKYGLNGAAYGTLIGGGVSSLCALIAVYKMFGVTPSLISLFRIGFGSGIIYLLAIYVPIPLILLPILYIVLFTLYFGMLILFKEISKDDIVMVRKLIPSWVPYVGNEPKI
jgi:O-antigen/teichoic acid export membrane protein